MTADVLRVVCAVILREDGHCLIARRLAHQPLGGLWEFPGGKLEPNETEVVALARELDEEVGIQPLHAEHWMDVHHRYPEREVVLHVWRVTAWRGEPYGRLGQPIKWAAPLDLKQHDIPAANRPIVNALALPSLCLITGEATDDASFFDRLQAALGRGPGMVILRGGHAQSLAPRAVELARRAGVLAMLNADPAEARAAHADGVHLNRHRLMACQKRPEGLRWVGASCHNAAELAQAARLGLDYALLSPVLPTASHPGAKPLGWPLFAALVADHALPVYALGGLCANDLQTALDHGAQGIAAIRAWW